MNTIDYILRASYGNDSLALIQWAREAQLQNVAILYNDTGWAAKGWDKRVGAAEAWVRSLGFTPYRTKSIGMEQLVRKKKCFPRQGMQFCTAELKMKPTKEWLDAHDPHRLSIGVIGVRREESSNRKTFPEFSVDIDGSTIWAPLVQHTEKDRNDLLRRAGIIPLPHRSKECYPCINSNRRDILTLTEDRIAEIEEIELSLGLSNKGQVRAMFRPYRHMGATGIREIVRWAKSPRGKFDLDDGNGSSGCEAGWCGL